MEHLTLSGIALDQCPRCEEIWFDADELDAAVVAAAKPTLEVRLPNKGASVWPCPRCGSMLHKAGWDRFVADRCGACRGLLIDVREWRTLLRGEVSFDGPAFETQFKDFMVQAGWTLLGAQGLVMALIRLLRD